MAFSGATKKLQQVVDMADELYSRLNELRAQLDDLRERVERTDERVERLERGFEDQQALLEALAEHEGVDVDAVLTEAAIEEAEGGAVVADAEGEPAGTEPGSGPDEQSTE